MHSEDLLKYDAEVKSKMSAKKWVMDNFVMHSHNKMKDYVPTGLQNIIDPYRLWKIKVLLSWLNSSIIYRMLLNYLVKRV